ncbi:ABC transporter substrate-binding protein [Salinimonas sp. HHU 13199]|uniref:ABC transporter substrate-binding protein n=2 Tax=Salinimonas profundi TaxID=2729140 RepID=A0ABR8LLI2_9ALTE|nr:ABC transporter substrate-binding protein [Salinimonas profundi]
MSVLLIVCHAALVHAAPTRTTDSDQTIVTLAPHLTEWVYSLEQQDKLLAVSAYSDYPDAAKALPRVADANGVNIKAIVKLQPDVILAWRGGNKPQDIARLKQLGFTVFESQPLTPADISKEYRQLGGVLHVSERARELADNFDTQLSHLARQYKNVSAITVFYYMWTAPLMSVGPDAWASKLLAQCGVQTLFNDAHVDYPQVSVQEVIRRQPDLLIAATSRNISVEQQFWSPHNDVLQAPVIAANPDIFSRFTLRLIPELRSLCKQIHQTDS